MRRKIWMRRVALILGAIVGAALGFLLGYYVLGSIEVCTIIGTLVGFAAVGMKTGFIGTESSRFSFSDFLEELFLRR